MLVDFNWEQYKTNVLGIRENWTFRLNHLSFSWGNVSNTGWSWFLGFAIRMVFEHYWGCTRIEVENFDQRATQSGWIFVKKLDDIGCSASVKRRFIRCFDRKVLCVLCWREWHPAHKMPKVSQKEEQDDWQIMAAHHNKWESQSRSYWLWNSKLCRVVHLANPLKSVWCRPSRM